MCYLCLFMFKVIIIIYLQLKLQKSTLDIVIYFKQYVSIISFDKQMSNSCVVVNIKEGH